VAGLSFGYVYFLSTKPFAAALLVTKKTLPYFFLSSQTLG